MESKSFNRRSLVGIIIILVGVAFLLKTFGVIDEIDFETYWPAILIVIGLFTLFDRSSSKLFGGIMLLLGVFFLLQTTGTYFEGVDIWELLWPLLLILVGIWFFFPKRKRTFQLDELNNTVIFSGANVINASQDFKGGEISAIFGGLEIDLRDSVIVSDQPVVIDAFTAFGGITIKVPDTWRVEINGLPLLGGWENKRRKEKTDPNAKVLMIKCFILCGGIEVK